MMRILINCANLHVGGGVAVAASFINALSKMDFGEKEFSLLVSSSVNRNLASLGANLDVFKEFRVVDNFGLRALWRNQGASLSGSDVVFTVFGPCYYFMSGAVHIVGFARPDIIYPSNPVHDRLPFSDKVVARFKNALRSLFFARADIIVVELEHVKARLKNIRGFETKDIRIVYSAVDEIYEFPSRWVPLEFPISRHKFRLGVISRNYPHKNLKVLPQVKLLLSQCFGIDIDFYVTFGRQEWEDCSEEFKCSILNVGSISLAQCPSFYSTVDGVIFPSLLECFSAVPIEAMASKRPLFASDLPFIRDVCGPHCFYFEPLDPESIAMSIRRYLDLGPESKAHFVECAYNHVKRFPNSEARCASYLSVIDDALNLQLKRVSG